MKTLLLSIAILFSTSMLHAQSINAPVYNNDGFYMGASLAGAAWSIEDSDTESGGGLGLKLGYNFNTNWGIYIGFDAVRMEPDNEGDYLLGQLDLGIQATFRSETDRFRPYAKAALMGLSAQDDDLEINGGGFAFGAGGLIYLTDNLAFDLSYTHAWVDLTEVKIGSETFEIDDSATTGRFLLGLTYHF